MKSIFLIAAALCTVAGFCARAQFNASNGGRGKTEFKQHSKQMVRFANITVDPAQLANYNAALKEQMTTAIAVEPGVLTYYAVADKSNPTHITILEIYADTAAYKKHIETPHFKKYKAAVEHMVKSLELVDLDLIGFAKKKDL